MNVEKIPSSLTLSALSLVVEEAGGRIEKISAKVLREMQAAFANIWWYSSFSWMNNRRARGSFFGRAERALGCWQVKSLVGLRGMS